MVECFHGIKVELVGQQSESVREQEQLITFKYQVNTGGKKATKKIFYFNILFRYRTKITELFKTRSLCNLITNIFT